MNIMTLENIRKTQGNKLIFNNVTAGIEDDDRIGVIGVNGTGKSTILSIIAGITEPDDGKVVSRQGLRRSAGPPRQLG
jgi:ATP-binding cassette subfamily F protein uup